MYCVHALRRHRRGLREKLSSRHQASWRKDWTQIANSAPRGRRQTCMQRNLCLGIGDEEKVNNRSSNRPPSAALISFFLHYTFLHYSQHIHPPESKRQKELCPT